MMKVCHEPRIMVNPILYTRSVLREMGGEREKERGERERKEDREFPKIVEVHQFSDSESTASPK